MKWAVTKAERKETEEEKKQEEGKMGRATSGLTTRGSRRGKVLPSHWQNEAKGKGARKGLSVRHEKLQGWRRSGSGEWE